MAQQTAVEWLIKRYHDFGTLYYENMTKAKAMEKEQIEKAFSNGQETPITHPIVPHYSGEEYYNETYNK